ncbi:protein BLISTER-like isoform X2 [Magnolia sinica]|nr:protein BLISTER-like isoform X2 [Magnolia sinica]XP_058085439.1 protein BLISTER-like isoform X2 [Magnolia sinica]
MAPQAVKLEYANAQLECSAADERTKILSSEVIGLEEKALRLKSNEPLLERQLENTNAELTSYKWSVLRCGAPSKRRTSMLLR